MARIQPIQVAEAADESRQLMEGVQRGMGMVPNLLKTLAQSPAALKSYLEFSRALHAALTPQLREQIALAVAGANGCSYCASAHHALGHKAGVEEDEMTANLRGESSNARTRAALQFALALVNKRGRVSTEDLNQVHAAGYGDPQVAEIIAVVALNLFTNYFNHVAETDIDFPYFDANPQPEDSACPLPSGTAREGGGL